MTGVQKGAKWSVDSLELREGNLYSYGWCADSDRTIFKLDLVLEYSTGSLETVTTQYGVSRRDVTATFPDLPSACGYLAYATLSSREPVKNIWLRLHHADGTRQDLSCPVPRQIESSKGERYGQRMLQWRLLLGYATRALRLVRQGQWRTVWQRAKALAARLNAPFGSDATLRDVFSRLAPGAVFVLDHSLGGGANKYSAELVQSLAESGRDVVLWTFTPVLLRHEICIHDGGGAPLRKFHLAWEKWELLLASRKVSEVVFNNCVGFPRQEQIPAMLLAFRQAGGARLRLLLHDFNMACPSYFLLNQEGKFCGVPDVSQCRQCLPRINDGLVRLFVARDIDLWRSRWGELLNVADEIVHFSPSSRTFLSRAYPSIRPEQWVFRPHRMSPPVGRFQYPRQEAGLRVAVVGQIGVHKGSEVVLALLEEAKRQHVNLHVVVVGTLEAEAKPEDITQTGVYKPENLATLLNQHAVHLALMPSIWAETFSYVTHELMGLMVPLLAFDFGAQAEAVSAYARGRVIPFGSAHDLLRELSDFKRELDSRDLS
ncbi:glycosyltransferase [Rhodoferax sp.]|uniref:glycosyltransferase n=1 Tax=Rhodoferax sp. TaxID=50421 RepID=UPI00274BA1E7|nr:glycosyltransferase [Rhodoferax sp.]